MKFCEQCGAQLSDQARFCHTCGSAVEQSDVSQESVAPPVEPEILPQKQKKQSNKTVAVLVGSFLVTALIIAGIVFGAKVWRDKHREKQDKEDTVASTTDAMVSDNGMIHGEKAENAIEVEPLERNMIMKNVTPLYNADLVPAVSAYQVQADFSNIINPHDVEYLDDEMKAKLNANQFVVSEGGYNEFFEVYESNRYVYKPNFVTVDSLMHTYHLYFQYLLKKTEKTYLSQTLSELSVEMLNKSTEQYNALKGSEWETAAMRNVIFFSVGAKLQGNDVSLLPEVSDVVSGEIENIMSASGVMESPALTTNPKEPYQEDYSQYKPRGYYEGDEQLEAYFRTMMWYGRMHYLQSDEDLSRSSLLMTMAMEGDTLTKWDSIYTITSFFAGASDDNGYYEYKPVIDAVYGEGCTVSDLIGKTEEWDSFQASIKYLGKPSINSVVVEDDGEIGNTLETVAGFRFMGQRFTVDAAIMQQLVYDNVDKNGAGELRMLPDVLDVPAALGSDTALSILEQQGDTSYGGYSENMAELREAYATDATDENATLWNASLYAGWLNTLRPLLEVKGEGYPSFMQTEEWRKKNLESFAGSYTELKHDTVLYSKQVMAEMGGGEIPVYDDRGYVEPEPKVYSRFANLSTKTAEGLKGFGMLSPEDEENLNNLAALATKLLTISEKELVNETLTDEEYELIRCYGGELEHFWYDAIKGSYDTEYVTVQEFPSALVVDVATDPNGAVLELGTGRVSTIYVVVPVDGTLRVASGSVYSFYQFEQPLSDRMTDSQWRQLLGLEVGADGSYNYAGEVPDQPEWTQSYRYNYPKY